VASTPGGRETPFITPMVDKKFPALASRTFQYEWSGAASAAAREDSVEWTKCRQRSTTESRFRSTKRVTPSDLQVSFIGRDATLPPCNSFLNGREQRIPKEEDAPQSSPSGFITWVGDLDGRSRCRCRTIAAPSTVEIGIADASSKETSTI